MKARHLLLMAAMAVAVLAAFNVAVGKLSANLPVHTLGHRLAAQPQVDFLFVGDSTMDSALDSKRFSAVWQERTGRAAATFNGSLRAASPVEHYLVTRRVLRDKPEVRWIVHGFWNLQLTEAPSANWTNHVGNRTLGYYCEPTLAAELYDPGSIVTKCRFFLLGHLPMVSERLNVWLKVERVRRQCEELGMAPVQSNPLGRVADLEAAVAPFVTSFIQRCQSAARERAPLAEAPARELRLSRERGIRAAVVSMPVNERHHRLFYASPAWRDYQEHVRKLVEREGALFVDASGWLVGNENFADTRHLNRSGARQFSEKLAAHLAGFAPPEIKAGK